VVIARHVLAVDIYVIAVGEWRSWCETI